jgi:hypothetical protein
MRKTSTKALTKNDNKIIGLNTNRKREMVKESEKYDTLKPKVNPLIMPDFRSTEIAEYFYVFSFNKGLSLIRPHFNCINSGNRARQEHITCSV